MKPKEGRKSMGMIMNYYQILGVSNFATFKEIKEAYRKKVKEFHPDKESGNAELFKRIKEAYEILKNDQKRKEYDELLFKTYYRKPNHLNQSASTKMSSVKAINIRRKNPKRSSLSSITVNTALILIGMMGKVYLNKRKNKI